MSSLTEAVAWSGTDAMLCLFVAWSSPAPAVVVPPSGTAQPRMVRTYEPQDDESVLGGRSIWEIDLIFNDVPEDIEPVVGGWPQSAIEAGGLVAWFGFEGSFDFEHILTADVAEQIYGVAVPGAVTLATDDRVRVSDSWTEQLEVARRALR